MLLTIDCGNTHIVLGVYKEFDLVNYWRISTDTKKTEDEYMVILTGLLANENLKPADITDMAMASVVPGITFVLHKLARKYFNIMPLIVDSRTDTGIEVLIDHPEEVGADRIINALAAHSIYSEPLIVVDFGTATTFDCISAEGAYLGGAIAPGIEISRQALFDKAARLANIPLERPEHIIGKNTTESVQSGILWGFGGQVDGIVSRMATEMGGNVKVIATGGLAQIIAAYSDTIDQVNPLLTLEGLRLVYERNK
jgi:type III pantothenate kinase